jgi:uncharacterized protein (TIGR03083 family)
VLNPAELQTILLDETRSFGSLISSCDASAPVPTCPGWTMYELFRHVGRGHRWAAHQVTERAAEPIDPRSAPNSEPPDDPTADGLDWLLSGASLLAAAVASTGPDTAVWTFMGPRPAWWWLRRRAFDTLVHTFDAAIAQGAQHHVTPEIATEALTEWLERVAAQPGADSAPLRPGRRLNFRATDTEGEWAVRGTKAGIVWPADPGAADVVLRGTAGDLLLVAVRRFRLEETGISVVGDASVWQEWLDKTPFESNQNRLIALMSATETTGRSAGATPGAGG